MLRVSELNRAAPPPRLNFVHPRPLIPVEPCNYCRIFRDFAMKYFLLSLVLASLPLPAAAECAQSSASGAPASAAVAPGCLKLVAVLTMGERSKALLQDERGANRQVSVGDAVAEYAGRVARITDTELVIEQAVALKPGRREKRQVRLTLGVQ